MSTEERNRLELDETDRKILSLLQQNARFTIKAIGEELNLSTSPVFERIKRLEKKGVIRQYVALLDYDKVGKKLHAFVQISLKDHSKPAVHTFVEQITHFHQVLECHYVSGAADFLIKVVVDDIEQYNHFILEELSEVPNISRMESLMSLSRVKQTTAIQIT